MTKMEEQPEAHEEELPDADIPVRHVVELDHKRRIEGKPYRSITLREPYAYELIEAMAKHATAAERYEFFITKLSDAPFSHVKKFHAADYMKLTDRIDGFLRFGQ